MSIIMSIISCIIMMNYLFIKTVFITVNVDVIFLIIFCFLYC